MQGLGDSLVEVEEYHGYYNASFDPEDFEGSGDVTATASGAEIPSFELTTQVPNAIQEIPDAVRLRDDEETVVEWAPSGSPDERVRLTLRSTTDTHGLPPNGVIECDVPDSVGRVVVPRALAERFPEVDGERRCDLLNCPSSTLARYRLASIPLGDGEVELFVADESAFPLAHDSRHDDE